MSKGFRDVTDMEWLIVAAARQSKFPLSTLYLLGIVAACRCEPTVLTVEDVRAMSVEICDAVSTLHSRGVLSIKRFPHDAIVRNLLPQQFIVRVMEYEIYARES